MSPASRLEQLVASVYGDGKTEDFDVDLNTGPIALPILDPPASPSPALADPLDISAASFALVDLDDARVAKDHSQSGPYVLPRDSRPNVLVPRTVTAQPSLDSTLTALETAATRDAATDLAMAYVSGRWASSLLVTIQAGAALGHRGHGAHLGAIENIALPIGPASLLKSAHDTKRVAADAPHGEIQDRLGRLLGQPSKPAAAPIVVAARVVGVIVVGDAVHGAAEAVSDLRVPRGGARPRVRPAVDRGEAAMTAELRLRAAVAGDYDAFVRLWRELEVGAPSPPAVAHWTQQMMPWTLFLATDRGEVVAYALVFPHGARGDVRQIAVDPAWRRRGIGRRLMAEVAERLRAAGCSEWRLEVRHDNAAALALYERAGMRRLHEIRVVSIARATLVQLAEPPSPRFTVAPVAPQDEPALEARYDLGAGELAQWRSLRPDATLWLVCDHDEPAGFARYCPTHRPGCALLFPFRARGAIAAAHLAAVAMRAPWPDRFELCVVDDPVADALLVAGGELVERMLEMSGRL